MNKTKKIIVILVVFALVVGLGTMIVFGAFSMPKNVVDFIDYVNSGNFINYEFTENSDNDEKWFTTAMYAYPAPIDKKGAYCIDPHTPNNNIGFQGYNTMKITTVVDILPPSALSDEDSETFEGSPAGGINIYTYKNNQVKKESIAINDSSAKILLKLGYLAIKSAEENETTTSLAGKKGYYKIALSEVFFTSKKLLVNVGFPTSFMNQYSSNRNVNGTVSNQISEANSAVSQLFKMKLINKTKTKNVTCNQTGEGDNIKTYIGPYKISFNKCTIDYVKYNGVQINKYATTVGGTLTDFDNLKSGDVFYIVVDGTVTNYNVRPKVYTKKVKLYRARMAFADGGDDTQNFIFFQGRTLEKRLNVILPPPNGNSGPSINIMKVADPAGEIKNAGLVNEEFGIGTIKAGYPVYETVDPNTGAVNRLFADDLDPCVAKYNEVNNKNIEVDYQNNVSFLIAQYYQTVNENGTYGAEVRFIQNVDGNNYAEMSEKIIYENYNDWPTYCLDKAKEMLDAGKAYEFKTGKSGYEDGQILVNLKDDDLIQGCYYRLFEISNPNKGYELNSWQFVDVYYPNTQIHDYCDPIYILNTKGNTSISGYVWEDFAETKGYTKNHVRDDAEYEYGINNIKVTLNKVAPASTVPETIATTYTGEYWLYDEINGGEYIFENISVSDLTSNHYYVEFEYNGLIYRSSDFGAGGNDYFAYNSKAIGQDDIFDTYFKDGIVNNGSYSAKVNGYDMTIGYANTETSRIKQINSYEISNCNTTARTTVNGWDENIEYSISNMYQKYKTSDGDIRYVNLGLYEKPQADLRVAKDLENVTVEFEEVQNQKYSQVYKYHVPKENEPNPANRWDVNSFQTQSAYQRNIYKSDIDHNNGGNISIYVTYKIALINEGPYNAIINNILEYYSSDFDIVNAWTEDGNEVLDCVGESPVNDSYKKCIIQTNKIQLSAGYGKCLYVRFKVNDDGKMTLKNFGNITEYNTIEINSYTVYKDNFASSVAAVDKDSIPGNAILEDTSTYEDDTAAAPPLGIKKEGERTIQGTVFEDIAEFDNTEETYHPGVIRQGNGKFDNTEPRIENVNVTLRNIDTGNEYKKVTSGDGTYNIDGFVPGRYEVIYTWGDNKYRVQTYKGTIYDYERDQNDVYWYKSEEDVNKSDAIDVYDERIKIDSQMTSMYRNLYYKLDKAYNGDNTDDIITSINSVTPAMTFNIEYTTLEINDNTIYGTYNVKGVDFGIIERAKQILDVEKRVTNFKITLANGQELVNATVLEDGTLQGLHTDVTYMGPTIDPKTNGWIKAEIDNELIEGAKAEIIYEIKYVNNSELDYMTKDFYKYGTVPDDKDKYVVKLTPFGVVDYLDKKLGFEVNKNKNEDNIEIWTEKDKADVKKWYVESPAEINTEKWYVERPAEIDTANLLYAEDKFKELKPQEDDSINLNVSKLLAASDDLTFDNKVDTVQIIKVDYLSDQHSGSIIEEFPEAADAERVMITPNTGDNKAYVVPVITGIVSLIILGVGIFMIKKKVIDN